MKLTKSQDMKKLLSSYNKSVRKATYKGIWVMKKQALIDLIQKDFKIIEKKNGKHQYKHKTGRFTKVY